MAHNLVDVVEKFEKARRLLEEESKKDPESEPYKSKYAAKRIFVSLKSDLKKLQDQEEIGDDLNKICIWLAVLDYFIGIICIETEELSTGEEHLGRCLESLKGHELESECLITVMSTLNQLGLLWSERNQPSKSKEYLEQAEKLYQQYLKSCPDVKLLYSIPDLFCIDGGPRNSDANRQKLESILTHTLYYLAQVYTSLGETQLAAKYCHSTLKRQLESKEYDPVDWALNSATLSQFFISKEDYRNARHHLACATYIMDRYESDLRSTENNREELDSKWENFRYRKADIARCWAKYGQVLLSTSKEKLLASADEDLASCMEKANMSSSNNSGSVADTVQESGQSTCTTSNADMLFVALEVTTIEDQVTSEFVLDFPQARQVFLNAKKWLDVAKEYYNLEDHASDCIQIIQDISILYKLLIFFEPSADRQCKMHKRRVDSLEGALKEINPQYYLDVCRQLRFELGEIYNDMRDIKAGMLQDGEVDPSTHLMQKMNHLANQSISYFQSFLATFRDSDEKMPSRYPDEIVRPALLAYFFIGRICFKMLTTETEKELEYLQKSLDNFQYLVQYCEDHAEVKAIMKEELEVCSEMVKLLPMKMGKVLCNT